MALHCHGCWLLRVSRAPGAAGALSGSLCAQSAPCASSWLLCSLLLELLLFSGNPTSTYRQWEPDPQQPVLGDQLCSGPLHFTYILDKDLYITRSHSLKKIFFFFFWPHGVAHRILAPLPGIKPAPPAVEAWSLNHWSAREVPRAHSLSMHLILPLEFYPFGFLLWLSFFSPKNFYFLINLQ